MRDRDRRSGHHHVIWHQSHTCSMYWCMYDALVAGCGRLSVTSILMIPLQAFKYTHM